MRHSALLLPAQKPCWKEKVQKTLNENLDAVEDVFHSGSPCCNLASTQCRAVVNVVEMWAVAGCPISDVTWYTVNCLHS